MLRAALPATDLTQTLTRPNDLRNRVDFKLLGKVPGNVSLRGRFEALSGEEIRISFERPRLRVGSWEGELGGTSQTQIRLVYLDDRVRLGKGSRGSLFVFRRRERSIEVRQKALQPPLLAAPAIPSLPPPLPPSSLLLR